jgi:hypothetical protein
MCDLDHTRIDLPAGSRLKGEARDAAVHPATNLPTVTAPNSFTDVSSARRGVDANLALTRALVYLA